ncbi:MAG: M16 family metallopeptidase [Candidatus Krumholzibacteriia bacterium]
MNRKGMTLGSLLLIALCLAAAAPADAGKGGARPWEKFKVAPLGEVQIPAYERVVLDNGMVLYLAEDHTFPLIELSATIRVGGIYEPADKVGLADITGSVMRTGGTPSWSGDEIDDTLESMGAEVETYIGDETGGAYLSSLSSDFDKSLAILAEVLAAPRFDQDKLELAKKEQVSAIARRNDDPMTIARREFARIIYGPDHPLGRMTEYATINAIGRDDLVRFHRDFVGPDRTYMVVIGDFQPAAMKAKLEQAFAGWARAAVPLPPDPAIPEFPRTVNVVDKSDLTQSTVLLGHLGIRASDPSYAGVQVANRILGGGFASRLFVEVRSNRGYAYSTGSAAGVGWRFPGVFMAFVGTKSGSTQDATRVIIDQIRRMTTEPVTPEELQRAKDGILNAEVFNFDTKRKILDRVVLYEMDGYPADFLQKYMAAVKAMTADQVLAACRAVWKPDNLSILAVGNPADWDGDLSVFGPVTKVDITIPEPKPTLAVPAATPASLQQGQALMTKAAEAIGAKSLAGLKGWHRKQKLSATIQGMALEFGVDETAVLPDRIRVVQTTPFGNMTQVINGEGGWAESPGGRKTIGPEDAAKAREAMQTELLRVLRDRAQLTCQALAPAQVDGRTYDRVYVTGAGSDYLLYYLDPATGLPAIEETKAQSMVTGAPVTQQTVYGDYALFGGLKLAKTVTIRHDGELFATGALEAFEANPAVTADTFK